MLSVAGNATSENSSLFEVLKMGFSEFTSYTAVISFFAVTKKRKNNKRFNSVQNILLHNLSIAYQPGGGIPFMLE